MIADHLFDESAAGALRYAERHRPGPLALAIMFLGPLVAPLVLVPTAGGGLASAVSYYVGGLVVLVLLFMSGWMNRAKVYDRAVVLDTAWPGGRPYVVPLSTIDPARVRYHERANLIGRRLGQAKRTLRTGPYTRQAVSFEGLSPRLAHRHGRDVSEARTQVVRPRARSLRVDDGAGRTLDLELATWVVGTSTPEPFLRALEQALVDARGPGAAGLAERTLARPVVERWPDPLTDEEIYGDTP
ncbi:hypothetical protein [Jiangella asiatica]|uniref:Uncharacterized protein n=1 Tax=Jiangella asiatica TaxID=2530372 RepID=A0A4R5CDY7_9ACTN|nr:hypothetical protein [Jiangella asiatica]TDD97106.1 hypothetical protein E1269_29890 [Jiangella asiatica]